MERIATFDDLRPYDRARRVVRLSTDNGQTWTYMVLTGRIQIVPDIPEADRCEGYRELTEGKTSAIIPITRRGMEEQGWLVEALHPNEVGNRRWSYGVTPGV